MKKIDIKKEIVLGIFISVISIIFISLVIDDSNKFEVVELIFSVFVPIYLFYLAYKLIDKRKLEIEDNKSDIFEVMFQEMLRICENYLIVSKKEGFNKYIVPKIKGSIPSDEDEVYKKIRTAPFIYEENINHLLENGTISKKMFEKYVNLKKLYDSFINFRITFYDHPELFLIHQNNLDEFINQHKIKKED